MKNRHLLVAVVASSLLATFLSLLILLQQGAHEREVAALEMRIRKLEARPQQPETLEETFAAIEKFFAGP